MCFLFYAPYKIHDNSVTIFNHPDDFFAVLHLWLRPYTGAAELSNSTVSLN